MQPEEPDRLLEPVPQTLTQTQDERTAFLTEADADNETSHANAPSPVGRPPAARVSSPEHPPPASSLRRPP